MSNYMHPRHQLMIDICKGVVAFFKWIYKKLFVVIILCGCSHFVYSQELEENKVDEFTKNTVKITSWEKFFQDFYSFMFIRVRKINETEFLEIKYTYSSKNILLVKSESLLMLKLQNDSIISIKAVEDKYSCRGCGAKGLNGSGAEGINIGYYVSKEDHIKLKISPVSKIRIYFSDGYKEFDIKDKNAELLSKELTLIE